MKSLFPDLAEALRRRISIIQDREFYQRDPQGHLAALQEVSAQITTIQGSLTNVPPDLGHYLERCSYDKALAWLESNPA